jgi:preprotein translocase subunit SecD
MINYPRWAILVTLVICLWGVVFAAPNFFDEPPSVLPESQVRLGLDLQGGAHLLLEVEVQEVINASLKSIQSEVRRVLRRRQPRISYTASAPLNNRSKWSGGGSMKPGSPSRRSSSRAPNALSFKCRASTILSGSSACWDRPRN